MRKIGKIRRIPVGYFHIDKEEREAVNTARRGGITLKV